MSINVLITSFGSNTSVGVAKALKSSSDIRIIGIDTNLPSQCAGYEFADKLIQAPVANQKEYDYFLREIIKEYDINCVIPIHDKEIETIARIADGTDGITNWAVNNYSTIDICNDKKKINKLLSEIVLVPEIFESIEKAQYPFIVKPNRGVSSRNIYIIKNERDKPTVDGDNDWIVQKFVEGTEYTVDCYTSYENPNVFKYAVRERIETKSGMSTKGKIVDIPVLGEYCKTIHSLLNYKGVSNIQFIENNGQFYFIEINPRFAGGGILTYKAGLNFPLFTVLELTKNIDIKEILNARVSIGKQMVRYLSETFFDLNGNYIRS